MHTTFEPNRQSKGLLNNPVIRPVPSGSREVVLVKNPVNNATGYEVRIGTVPGLWNPAGIYDAKAEIVIRGLIPGLEYYISARAMNAGEVSAWSDQVVFRTR